MELTCPIDVDTCGELHSLKWFKGTDRIAVVSGDGEVAKVEGSYNDRVYLAHENKRSRLIFKNVEISDEDTYLCETTFLEPSEACENSGAYSIALNVYGEYSYKYQCLLAFICCIDSCLEWFIKLETNSNF